MGLGVHLKNFDINKTKLYEGKIDEEIDKRPVTPCILPDEDVKKKKKKNIHKYINIYIYIYIIFSFKLLYNLLRLRKNIKKLTKKYFFLNIDKRKTYLYIKYIFYIIINTIIIKIHNMYH